MSQWISFASSGGGGSPVNPDYVWEMLGTGTNAANTTITAAGSAHVQGTASDFGPSTADYNGFEVVLHDPSPSNARWGVAVSLDGGSNYKPTFYMQGGGRYFIPLQVTSGTTIKIKVQCTTASGTVLAMVRGRVPLNSINPPGFTIMEDVIAMTTGTTVASAVAITPALNQTLNNIGSTTAQTYGAFMATVGNTSAATVARRACIRIGEGSNLLDGYSFGIAAATGAFGGATFTFYNPTPSGTQLKGGIESNSTADSFPVNIIGFR